MDWREYQEKVAALFRAAGCSAEVEKSISGVRNSHYIDVYVTFHQYGIECVWIVECKHWNKSVKKEQVMTLLSIVDDCGADRGIIVSKRGFQSGAIQAAYKRNITLTSIDDLQNYINEKTEELEELYQRLAEVESQRDDAEEQLNEYRCPQCGASMVSREPIWYDEDNEGIVETFPCGYETGGLHGDRPCPFGPDFPSLNEYELTIFGTEAEPVWKYQCFAAPKTEKARHVRLDIGYGESADEAREAVIEHYRYLTTPPGQEFRGKWRSRTGYPTP